MTSIALGIPADTPENTVKNILAILEEEAKRENVELYKKENGCSIGRNKLTININLNGKGFRIFLQWVDANELAFSTGGIGDGEIKTWPLSKPWETNTWTLELLHGDDIGPLGWVPTEEHPSPPFRWGVFHERDDLATTKPPLILDGHALRAFLYAPLGHEPLSTT